jgi:hypothetical protein
MLALKLRSNVEDTQLIKITRGKKNLISINRFFNIDMRFFI